MVKVKCPKCRKVFSTYAIYTKHYASAHYKPKKGGKGKKAGTITGKIPVWAKRSRK